MPRERLSDRPVITRLTTGDTRKLLELARREDRLVAAQARLLLSHALRAMDAGTQPGPESVEVARAGAR